MRFFLYKCRDDLQVEFYLEINFQKICSVLKSLCALCDHLLDPFRRILQILRTFHVSLHTSAKYGPGLFQQHIFFDPLSFGGEKKVLCVCAARRTNVKISWAERRENHDAFALAERMQLKRSTRHNKYLSCIFLVNC